MQEDLGKKKELATEEESGACAHCRMQGEVAVQCVGHLGILVSRRAHCADLIRGVQYDSRLSPPKQSSHNASNGGVLKAKLVSIKIHGDARVVSYLGEGLIKG